jgi:hypothetical protein
MRLSWGSRTRRVDNAVARKPTSLVSGQIRASPPVISHRKTTATPREINLRLRIASIDTGAIIVIAVGDSDGHDPDHVQALRGR